MNEIKIHETEPKQYLGKSLNFTRVSGARSGWFLLREPLKEGTVLSDRDFIWKYAVLRYETFV